MPRKPRKLSSTGIYHIMARGIDRMAIFHDDEDREKYLEILADCLPGEMPVPRWETVLSSDLPTALEDGSSVPASRDKGDRPQVQNHVPATLYQYCLMDNHVHLLLKTGSESLSHLMKRIGVRYAAYFKWKYHRTGHLFQDRFRSEPVEEDSYLLAVYRYIALNPVKAGLCEKPGLYPWCGYQDPSWGTVLSVTPKVGEPSDLSSSALELLHPLPVDVPSEQLRDYILADIPEIHPFAERVLDGEAESLLLLYSGLNTALDVSRLTRQQQLVLFYRLLEEGVSIQQMARLTGIAKTNIARWLP